MHVHAHTHTQEPYPSYAERKVVTSQEEKQTSSSQGDSEWATRGERLPVFVPRPTTDPFLMGQGCICNGAGRKLFSPSISIFQHCESLDSPEALWLGGDQLAGTCSHLTNDDPSNPEPKRAERNWGP